MKLLTKAQREKLIANGLAQQAAGGTLDPVPVVRLFTPDAGATWLLCELDPDDHDIAFGLCDLGVGFPELGCVSLSEIINLRGNIGLPVERDRYWKPAGPISRYVDAAFKAERIVEPEKGGAA